VLEHALPLGIVAQSVSQDFEDLLLFFFGGMVNWYRYVPKNREKGSYNVHKPKTYPGEHASPLDYAKHRP